MLDELYEDVLSVMKEYGFVDWFHKTHPNGTSPLNGVMTLSVLLKRLKHHPKTLDGLLLHTIH